MPQDLYRELQQRLDTYSIGFPATESGIEIEILKKLFSQEDARLFLALTPMLETPASVAARLSRPEEEVAGELEDMAARGLLFRLQKGDSVKYGAIPFVHGLYEFQVKRVQKDFARMVERYFQEALGDAMAFGAEYFLRTIPVNQSIDVKHQVATFEDACGIFRNQTGKIVVTDCICRKQQDLLDGGCGKPLEACFMFGSMGQYYLDHGMGREVSVSEAEEIVARAQEAGLVTQPATAQNPGGMCNCCGDCCGVLRSLNAQPRPAQMIFSNHFAMVEQEACTGCGTCLDRCQMAALSPGRDDVAEVDLDRCIGCGLCATTCPVQAIRLVPKEESARRLPPASTFDQMMAMAQKRGMRF